MQFMHLQCDEFQYSIFILELGWAHLNKHHDKKSNSSVVSIKGDLFSQEGPALSKGGWDGKGGSDGTVTLKLYQKDQLILKALVITINTNIHSHHRCFDKELVVTNSLEKV